MDKWYILRGGIRYGPFPHAHLQGLTATGQLLPADLVMQGENGSWGPALQVPGLFQAVEPPTPDTSPQAQNAPFNFGPMTEPSDAPPSTANSPEDARRQANLGAKGRSSQMPLIAAVAGGLLVLVVVGIYFGTRDTTKGSAPAGDRSAGNGKDRKAKGQPASSVVDVAVPGMPISELLAQVPPPAYSWRHRLNHAYQEHVWKVGDNHYVHVTVTDNRVKRVQDGMKEVYFENLKKTNAKTGDTFTP